MLQIEKDIFLQKNYDIGNSLIYELCNKHSLSLNMDIKALSAEMWLIGRSYAASPERRSYRTKDGERLKITFSNSGDGLDTFFDKVSKEIINHSEFNNLVNHFEYLNKKSYSYDNSVEDIDVLKKAYETVFIFQKILRDSIKIVDNNDLGDNKNNVEVNYFTSFSSKFMHFQLPNCIFIIDSISNSHLQRKYSFVFPEGVSKIKSDSVLVKNLINIHEQKSSNVNISLVQRMQWYINHCCREYMLGYSIKKEYPSSKVTPRTIDSFVMYANQKNKNEKK